MIGKLLAVLFWLLAFGLAQGDALAQGESKTIKIQDVPGVRNMLFRALLSVQGSHTLSGKAGQLQA